ncbi:hypothetical protein VOLCADRAFT_108693 [Volvox carteri f. nagariensis]|uniref:Uncharacterized protein n=1 Tax=Volvox carteri f. nagariensis TaxID=3068 RepID=D8ULW4_VOLCA|nr:uncharacterized protein VOLCADRAFT_108693 [Volvox carteri f. nagariensis]EFJ39286.1 hypothetical protein VOLCADRAFT_108693 [Volvox carteri f. nagariensis]|eukprot:XP_002959649.1 hypothetical protein VOLCADRAFT_108693 [Volvox carteri f. nagariensis]
MSAMDNVAAGAEGLVFSPEMHAFFERRLAEERESVREALTADFDRRLKEQEELSQLKLAQARSENLPQCAEPPNLANHPSLRESWAFVKDARVATEQINVMLTKVADNTSSKGQALMTAVNRLTNLIDLRLAAYTGAMDATTTKKAEFVMRYYATFRSKALNPTGHWATGERKFKDVQMDEAAIIDTGLMRPTGSLGGNSMAYTEGSGNRHRPYPGSGHRHPPGPGGLNSFRGMRHSSYRNTGPNPQKS